MDFVTSDNHFGHFNVIAYSNRPFTSVDEMDKEMIRRWNSVVGPQDRVFHVGDFAFLNKEKATEVLSKLNGIKILIKGNHDGNAKRMLEIGFSEVYNTYEVDLAEQKVLMCHYPYRPSQEEIDNSEYKIKNVQSRPEDKGGWLIHGHVHNLWKFRNKMLNASVENWNYTPVSFSELERIIKENPNGFKDTVKV